MKVGNHTFRLITFIGMPRSGNHGIIQWMLDSFDSVMFFNNFHLKGNYLDRPRYLPRIEEHKPAVIIISLEVEDILERLNHQNLNYKDDIKVLLIRDPYNLYASKRQLATKRKKGWAYADKKVHTFARNWKQYAREWLGDTNYLGDKACISYNRWVEDGVYRRGILKHIGADRWDVPNNKMMTRLPRAVDGKANGGTKLPGSSFDGFKNKDTANEQAVFERWKHYENTHAMKILREDKELAELNDRILLSTECI